MADRRRRWRLVRLPAPQKAGCDACREPVGVFLEGPRSTVICLDCHAGGGKALAAYAERGGAEPAESPAAPAEPAASTGQQTLGGAGAPPF